MFQIIKLILLNNIKIKRKNRNIFLFLFVYVITKNWIKNKVEIC